MPTQLRGEERWAAALIGAALHEHVEPIDDGSGPGLHDLEIRYGDGRVAAVEVTAAADGRALKTWRALHADDGGMSLPGRGRWLVSVEPNVNVRRLRKCLPPVLAELHDQGALQWRPRLGDGTGLREAGVRRLSRYADGEGARLYFTFRGTGGWGEPTGSAVSGWVGSWLPDQRDDVVRKLAGTTADERHAFVFVPGFADVPWAVQYYLMFTDYAALPVSPPALPTPLTHVWLISTWGEGSGVRWTGDDWRLFENVTTVAA